MSRLIYDEIRKLNVSEPIFELGIMMDWSDKENVKLLNHIGAKANNEETNDPIQSLVVQNFVENFSSVNKRFTVDRDMITARCMETIRKEIALFANLEGGKKKKNFSNSDIGKWYDRYIFRTHKDISVDLKDKLTILYKFLKTESPDIEKQNAAGYVVIEALFNKYFDKTHIQLRRSRRRK